MSAVPPLADILNTPIYLCWLCGGLGGIAVHERWTAERGKPLWTAHEHPSRDGHQTHPCPVCTPVRAASQGDAATDSVSNADASTTSAPCVAEVPDA